MAPLPNNLRTFVQGFESCKLTAYQDQRGIWTIGWGHTGNDVRQGMTCTQAEADAWLDNDLSVAWAAVTCASPVLLACDSRIQIAIADFCYNIGQGDYVHSTACTFVNQADWPRVCTELMRWVHAGAIVSDGLVRRRTAECNLIREANGSPAGPSVQVGRDVAPVDPSGDVESEVQGFSTEGIWPIPYPSSITQVS